MMDARERLLVRLSCHEATLMQPGYAMPNLESTQMIELRPGVDLPDGLSAIYRGRAREGVNYLICAPGEMGEYILEFTGVGNIAFFGMDKLRRGRCQFLSDDCTFVAMGGARQKFNLSTIMHDENSLVYIGKEVSSNSTNIAVGGGKSVIIGEDCMLSWGVIIRASDIHAVVDLVAGKVINEEEDVVIGPHVWVGPDVLVNKGITIGPGSILSRGAIVTKDVPATSLAAGVPAVVKRSAVSWTRKSPIRVCEADIQSLIEASKGWK